MCLHSVKAVACFFVRMLAGANVIDGANVIGGANVIDGENVIDGANSICACVHGCLLAGANIIDGALGQVIKVTLKVLWTIYVSMRENISTGVKVMAILAKSLDMSYQSWNIRYQYGITQNQENLVGTATN